MAPRGREFVLSLSMGAERAKSRKIPVAWGRGLRFDLQLPSDTLRDDEGGYRRHPVSRREFASAWDQPEALVPDRNGSQANA